MTEARSPAMQWLGLLWDEKCRAVPHSWRLVNGGMRDALHMAIRMGLRFGRQDFAWMAEGGTSAGPSEARCPWNFGYWMGTDNAHNCGEQFYTTAVKAGNRSACHSFEAWKQREPFYVDAKRLHLDALFTWDNREVLVTRFDDGKRAIIACAYPEISHYINTPYGVGKPVKRYVLTHANLRTRRHGAADGR